MTTEAMAARGTSAALVVRPDAGRERAGARSTGAAGPARMGADGPTDRPATPRTAPCRCGHGAEAHEHYRPGSDCGACGAQECARFRPQGRGWWRPRAR